MKIPRDRNDVTVDAGGKSVALTNLNKTFFPEIGKNKGDLLQYYADVAPFVLPHIEDRAMVMKRYPNGATGDFFFMKETPNPHPKWLETVGIEHSSGKVVNFPVINDLASLLWLINLGCIDLNQWYARIDDVDRPDFLVFDLDPGTASFDRVREVALLLHDGLASLKIPSFAKTTGSKGIHVYVPIKRGPLQEEVHAVAKEFASAMVRHDPKLMTAIYNKSKRPKNAVLVDYNQNRWGATLASIYSVRPTPAATVSFPVTWEEIERGVEIDEFRMDNVPALLKKAGDLWKPLLGKTKRFDLAKLTTLT
jgi:bifunctional non-homologous end joining protein LigD